MSHRGNPTSVTLLILQVAPVRHKGTKDSPRPQQRGRGSGFNQTQRGGRRVGEWEGVRGGVGFWLNQPDTGPLPSLSAYSSPPHRRIRSLPHAPLLVPHPVPPPRMPLFPHSKPGSTQPKSSLVHSRTLSALARSSPDLPQRRPVSPSPSGLDVARFHSGGPRVPAVGCMSPSTCLVLTNITEKLHGLWLNS